MQTYKPESWNVTILRSQDPGRGKTGINPPISMFEAFLFALQVPGRNYDVLTQRLYRMVSNLSCGSEAITENAQNP